MERQREALVCGACGQPEGEMHHGECQGYPALVEARDARRRCHADPRTPDSFDGEEL